VSAAGGSDAWDDPQYMDMYITNLRHTREGPLEPFKIEALYPDTVSVVEQNLSIPVLPVIARSSVLRQNGLRITAIPQSLNAGVRTTLKVEVQTRGPLPRTAIV